MVVLGEKGMKRKREERDEENKEEKKMNVTKMRSI